VVCPPQDLRGPAGRTSDIILDGAELAEQRVERRSPEKSTGFSDVEYKVPAGLVNGKQKATVRFQAAGGNEIAAVYGVRMIRADAER
jgi:hypothetical protein